MKWFKIRLLQVVLLFLAFSSMFFQLASADSNGVIAVVNQHVITKADLDKRIQLVVQQMQAAHQPRPPETLLRKHVLQQMINNFLLLDAAKKQKITVSDSEVQNQIQAIAAQNHVSVIQLKKMVTKEGYLYPDYVKQIKEQLIISALQKKLVIPNISVSKEEIASFSGNVKSPQNLVSQFHLQVVIVQISNAVSKEQLGPLKAKIMEIATKLQSGEDPKTIAIVESSDHMQVKGGDMGWKSDKQLPPDLVAKLLQAKKGSVMPPFQTPQGIYVVRLVDKKQSSTPYQPVQYQIDHISLKTDALNSVSLTTEKAKQIRQQILNGVPFAKMAELNSQDANTALKSGSLGWVYPEEMPVAVAEVLPKLKVGEVSQPILSGQSVELIKLVAKRKTTNAKGLMTNQAKEVLFQQKLNEQMAVLLNELRGSAYIKIEGQ